MQMQLPKQNENDFGLNDTQRVLVENWLENDFLQPICTSLIGYPGLIVAALNLMMKAKLSEKDQKKILTICKIDETLHEIITAIRQVYFHNTADYLKLDSRALTDQAPISDENAQRYIQFVLRGKIAQLKDKEILTPKHLHLFTFYGDDVSELMDLCNAHLQDILETPVKNLKLLIANIDLVKILHDQFHFPYVKIRNISEENFYKFNKYQAEILTLHKHFLPFEDLCKLDPEIFELFLKSPSAVIKASEVIPARELIKANKEMLNDCLQDFASTSNAPSLSSTSTAFILLNKRLNCYKEIPSLSSLTSSLADEDNSDDDYSNEALTTSDYSSSENDESDFDSGKNPDSDLEDADQHYSISRHGFGR